MLKRIIVYLVVLCFLPTISIAAQTEEHLTWTIEELSAIVSLKEQEDGLPVYVPKAPVEGVALYIHDLQTRNGNPSNSLNMRNYILDLMEGSLLFTDDPDQASIMLFYEEWNDFAASYTASTSLVHAYSSTARLQMISLTDEGAQPTQASHTNSPGDVITSSGTSWYAQMPNLCQTKQMDPLITALLAMYLGASDRVVKIGSSTVRRDAREVNLSSLKITDISPLSGLPMLITLNLGNNDITDLSPLSNLGSLEELNLTRNQITDITPLSGLGNLRSLYLSYNEIIDLSPLSGLVKLEKLNLYGIETANITPLSGLVNLRSLHQTGSGITDLSPLSGLAMLEDLYLAGNEISDLSPLSKLSNLRYLELANNRITDLSPLSDLERLEELFINRNQVSDFSPLYALTGLKKLETDSESMDNEAFRTLKKHLPNCHIVRR